MKIIMQPKFHPAKCPCCGTVFEIEKGDQVDCSYAQTYGGEINSVDFIAECPVCSFDRVPIKTGGMIAND